MVAMALGGAVLTMHVVSSRINNREEALGLVWSWADALEDGVWTGQGGASARVVAESLAQWAHRRGGIVFTAAVAEIAIEAGLSYGATKRALCTLEDSGWVRRRVRGSGRMASVWELSRRSGSGAARIGGGDQDWTRWRAVGKSGFLIWRCAVGGASSATIAAQRDLTVQHVRKVLARLEALGAVERRGGRWFALTCTDLAAMYGVEGAKLREIALLEKQRGQRTGKTGPWRTSAEDRSFNGEA